MKESCGYDEISTKMLKTSAALIRIKKGDKGNIANYRLISLLTSFSNVFEKDI
jgi:hypothetical protein